MSGKNFSHPAGGQKKKTTTKKVLVLSCMVGSNLPLSTACSSLSTVSSFRSGEIKNWANLKCWDKVTKHELEHTCICNMHNYHMFSVTVGKKIIYKISQIKL